MIFLSWHQIKTRGKNEFKYIYGNQIEVITLQKSHLMCEPVEQSTWY